MIHKPIHDLQSLDLDKEKRGLKKAKNRRTPEDTDQVILIKGKIHEFLEKLYFLSSPRIFNVEIQLISNLDFQLSSILKSCFYN